MGPHHFVLKRLHSLTGILPIGFYLVEHFFVNSYATRGPEAFNRAAGFMQGLPYLLALEIVVLYLPILYHGVYGLFITYGGSSNAEAYGSFRNWMYLLQRASGVIVFAFIGFHVWNTRLSAVLAGAEVNFRWMAGALSDPWVFAFYVVGVIAAVFHFANGLWSFLITWGITPGRRAQGLAAAACGVIFVGLSYVGVDILLAFV